MATACQHAHLLPRNSYAVTENPDDGVSLTDQVKADSKSIDGSRYHRDNLESLTTMSADEAMPPRTSLPTALRPPHAMPYITRL